MQRFHSGSIDTVWSRTGLRSQGWRQGCCDRVMPGHSGRHMLRTFALVHA